MKSKHPHIVKLARILNNESQIVPSEYYEQLELFCKRNAITSDHNLIEKNGRVCLQCLKAFALKAADNLMLNPEAKSVISSQFKCETGHNNYYLDDNELKLYSLGKQPELEELIFY